MLLSPLIGFLVLRMRSMSPPGLLDPGIHTIYILDPRDVFFRYAQAYASTARLREGARAGFLVPARISYLLFGGVGGFYVFRWTLAVLAAGSAYLLLRRCYGRLAGVAGIIAVLSSPVLIEAWGTDYPDSAAVSYLLAGLACLAMPSAPSRRRVWMSAGAFFLVMATWSHGMGALLTVATIVAYLAVRVLRGRPGLLLDIGILAAVAVVTTVLLMGGSKLVLGQFDFVKPTIESIRFLSKPAQEALWHSTSARWAPYVAYLLVLPAMVLAYAVTFAIRRRRPEADGVTDTPVGSAPEARPPRIATPQLVVGLALAVQVVLSAFMQFVGKLQTLEMHYFSSTLWAAALLALAIVLVELMDRAGGRYAQVVPCAVLLVVPLVYALVRPTVPTFGWWPYGWLLVGLIVLSVLIASSGGRLRDKAGSWLATGIGLAGVVICGFVLTIANQPNHPQFAGTAVDPPPVYADALGSSGTVFVEEYRIGTELPSFVGNATYRGEQLLMWTKWEDNQIEIDELGEYHGAFNMLPHDPPYLTTNIRQDLDYRRPAELLLLDTTRDWMAQAVASLAPYGPTVVRSAVLRSGNYVLYVELLALHEYPPVTGAP